MYARTLLYILAIYKKKNSFREEAKMNLNLMNLNLIGIFNEIFYAKDFIRKLKIGFKMKMGKIWHELFVLANLKWLTQK